ncbi:MAG: Stk1 family PASTA domain-containing Ser/Thr kinase, partial [Lachnospiraceae bacterium]|nr:Stk1 family PASTA domain-containing Ser/Thr kinase [Lachnospiraceae bacterium]
MVSVGMLIADRYEIVEKVGSGGMSDVYRAKDHKLNRFVAVKALKQEFSENANFVSKFRVEAQAAAGLMHPNIVNVYDVGEEKGLYYIVMELVEGITLKKYIEKKARLSVKETISIAIQVSMGLEAAHKNHIIHRDIKPQNIIISRDGKVKVTDFGIAKAATSNTITSNVMGSVHYTSPEQARGGYSDEKSDIYSLGITLFEMLTGRVPFNGETTVAIAIKHIQQPMPSPCEFVPEIPRSVEQIVLKCCEKSPDRRYQNMSELLADLKESLLHPNDDFVKVIHPDEESMTRPLSAEERQNIRSGFTGPQNYYQNYETSYTEDGYGQDYHNDDPYAGEPSDGAYYEEAYEDDYPENYEDDYREPDDTVHLNRADRKRYRKSYSSSDDYGGGLGGAATVLAVILAILLGLAIILYVASRLGIFPFSPDEDDGPGAVDVISTEIQDPDVPLGPMDNTASGTENQPGQEGGIIIPDVVGLRRIEANVRLNEKNLRVNIQEVASESVEKDYVIDQNPAANDRAPSGSTVTITVSSGPDLTGKARVPDVVYKSEDEAKAAILQENLEIGNIEYVDNNDTNLKGKVISQSIQEGMYVDEHTKVDLVIVNLPKVYGYTGQIIAPTPEEDPGYVAGTTVYVIVRCADGTELLNSLISSFPISANYHNLNSATGTVDMAYTDATGAQKQISRQLVFTPE